MHPGGAEVELSLLFVDVRGSTTIAERVGAADFSRLMNQFYAAATHVLIKTDALIDKLVGDEVIGLYLPLFTGPNHARAAIKAADGLLHAIGQGLPIGIGVHTGIAYVGTVRGAENTVTDVTALGDNVNTAARLASNAKPGEALISDAACSAAGLNLGHLDQRQLALKGKSAPISVRVMRASAN